MALEEEALKRIMELAKRLTTNTKSLHLSNIAKSIEQQEGCQIFIVPVDDKATGLKSTRWVATCESYMTIKNNAGKASLKKSETIPICHHFIFYKPCPNDIEVERLRVAHGLAHCALHWPLGPRKNRLVKGNLHGIELYLVKFTEEEEQQANVLASLLIAYKQQI